MACVTVLVGQCGTQLGGSFLHRVASDARRSDNEEFQHQVSSTFFRPPLRASQGAGSRGGLSASCRVRRFRPSRMGDASGVSEPVDPVAEGGECVPLARCVLVDMEPKAVEDLVTRTNSGRYAGVAEGAATESGFRIAPSQCVTREEGSANNWAFGYFHQGSSRYDLIVENLRREAEASGAVQAFHVVHSIAGGTGSGVGCLVAEAVRDVFPRSLLLHSVVWPLPTGEVTTQWYNVALAMSCLRDEADAVCVLYNEDASRAIASRRLHNGLLLHPSDVSFRHLNDHMGGLLSSMFLPASVCRVPTPRLRERRVRAAPEGGSHHPPAARRHASPADIVEALAVNPTRKFFTGCDVQAVEVEAERHDGGDDAGHYAPAWTQVLRDAVRVTVAHFHRETACLWSLRGRGMYAHGLPELQHVLAAYAGGSLASGPAPGPSPHRLSTGALSLLTSAVSLPSRAPEPPRAPSESVQPGAARPAVEGGAPRMVSAAVFGTAPVMGQRLGAALDKVEEMRRAKAFLHHYEKYGLHRGDLDDAVIRLWDTVSYYR